MFYFLIAANIRQILEVLLEEIKVQKECRKVRKGVRAEDTKEIIPTEFKRGRKLVLSCFRK
jgi:hypothetical protein